MRQLFSLLLISLSFSLCAAEIRIIPPKGWEGIEDAKQLPQKVKLLFVGDGTSPFNPSLNIAMEETVMSPKEYVRLAKSYHEEQKGTLCKQIGTMDTGAGPAHILQIDRPTQWGDVRFMQAIVLRDQKAYVLTATCLHEEFPSLSQELFHSIKSFRIEK